LRAGEHGGEFGAQPEGLQSIVCGISDPNHPALRGETSTGTGRRQLSVWSKEAGRIHIKRTIRQTLPVLWPEEAFWHQMVRLIVQAAVEERSGKLVLPIITRGCDCELLNPCQPSFVFYL